MTPRGRMIMVERIAAGRPIAHVAAEMGVSRKTADKWWRRWQAEGLDGLDDRSSRPHRCPHQTPARVEQRIVRLRQRRKLGPARISSIVGVPASTVHRVLCRHGLNRLAWMDRPTGQVIRRLVRGERTLDQLLPARRAAKLRTAETLRGEQPEGPTEVAKSPCFVGVFW